MLKRWSWLAVGMIITAGAFGMVVQAKPAQVIKIAADKPAAPAKAADDDGSEAGLDLTLRTHAAAQPVKTADGSVLTTPASHVYLVDFDTSSVLAEKASDLKMYPSSMTKMMTIYIIFDHLKQGTLGLDSQFTVSEKAWRTQGSKMFVPLGEQISLENLIRGIAIQSGNDACVVVAEGIAGSEEAFAKQMNETAKQLGMTNTNFVNANGLPSPDHTTTPHDLEVLAAAIIREFPQYYHYVSEREFTYHGIRQFNRNLLLGNPSMHVDGLKTGHTDAAGYGITLSAKDPVSGRRLVLVLNGLDSDADRASEGERLLKWGFLNFEDVAMFKAGQHIASAKVFMGEKREIPLTIATDVKVTVPKVKKDAVKAVASYKGPLIAPVNKGDAVGILTLTYADGSTQSVPLVAGADVVKLSWFGRIGRSLGL